MAINQLTPWPPLFSREGVTSCQPCRSPSLGERGGEGGELDRGRKIAPILLFHHPFNPLYSYPIFSYDVHM